VNEQTVNASRPAPSKPPAPAPGTREAGTRPSWRRWLDDRVRAQRPEPARPWRVEGSPNGEPARGIGWFWWALLGALAVNWLVSSAALAPPDRAEVSYTFFVEQVEAGNVAEITTTADTIEGTFDNAVRYPAGQEGAPEATRFTTQRPAWADDGLSDKLARSDVAALETHGRFIKSRYGEERIDS